MKLIKYLIFGLISSLFLGIFSCKAVPFSAKSEMLYIDTDRKGRPFAKDPSVVKYQGNYWMYYSVPPYEDKAGNKSGGLAIGIAQSSDLNNWKKVGAKNNPDFDLAAWSQKLLPLQGLTTQQAIDYVRNQYFSNNWKKGDSEAIQIGLYDLLGKEQNKPTIELWGLKGRAPVSGIFTILEKDINKAIGQAKIAQTQNLTSYVKVKLFGKMEVDIPLIKAIRNYLGDQTFILGDPNRGYKHIKDLDQLASVLKELHAAGMNAVEDPADLSKADWTALKKKVGKLALAPDKIMRPAHKGIQQFSPDMGSYFNLHPNQMGSLKELNTLASTIRNNNCGLMIGDSSLVGPACTFWQQIAIGHGASWVEALEKPQENEVFQQCMTTISTAKNEQGQVVLKKLRPGFGLAINEVKLKAIADNYLEVF